MMQIGTGFASQSPTAMVRQDPVKEVDNFFNEGVLGFGGDNFVTYGAFNETYDRFTDQFLNEYEINQLSAVWGGLALISRSISMLPLILYKKNKNTKGLEPVPMGEYVLEILLEDAPTNAMTNADFLKSIVWNMVLHGNAYVQVIRDGFGVPRELIPLIEGSVHPIYDYDPPVYSYRYHVDGVGELEDHQIIHIKNVTATGREGKSLLYNAKRVFALAAALDRYAATYFGNGAWPGIIFEKAGTMNSAKKRRTLSDFNEAHRGPDNAHKAAIIDEDLKVKQISYKNEESQFDESRERAVLEIARYLQIPPHMLGVLNSEPKANFTEAYLMYHNNVIRPYLYIIESAFNQKLLTKKERRTKGLCFKFDASSLVQGNMVDRAKAIQIAASLGGVVKVNEAREKVGLQPVSKEEGGEDFIGAQPQKEEEDINNKEDEFNFDREKLELNGNGRLAL